jgi:hypothetical protein
VSEKMREKILCDTCKKQIGTIDKDALVIDGEFGNIGIEKYCKDCKKETYNYENDRDWNDLIKEENPVIRR